MRFNKERYPISREWQLILFFALAKLLIHIITHSNYDLHRDAYLYYAQSEHLSWGYFEVPPFIAVLGKIATTIFGNTIFGLRFFPALIGSINLIIIGLAVRELGGKKIAILLASLGYILSPAYLHTNALFQPVSFNQHFWLLSSYLVLRMIRREDPKIWLWLAIVFGFAFLNKYSIVFLYSAYAISALVSEQRIFYKSKYFVYAIVVGLVIISPNLMWQYRNNWPIIDHMSELRETQLIHISLSDFIIDQFLMNMQAVLLWVGPLFVLLFYEKERKYRVFGLTYLVVALLLMVGSGKSYYMLGIYPILFVFGAYFVEKYLTRYLKYIVSYFVLSMFISLYISLSFDGIPFISFEKAYSQNGYRWEDGMNHDIPQDMADMTGWKEIGQKVGNLYQSLGPEGEGNCDIYCYHYGQAGAIMFYGKKQGVPQPISFNGSFVFWAPDSLTKEFMIWVHSDMGNDINPDSLLPNLFQKVELKATIDNKNFRENGTRIYLCRFPKDNYKHYYAATIRDLKGGNR